MADVIRHASAEAVARAGAAHFVQAAAGVLTARPHVYVALSGGSTPLAMFDVLVESAREALDWSRVHFFWGDERHVSPEHPDSNYGAARRHLLAPLGIASEQIHRFRAERAEVELVAGDYEDLVCSLLGGDGIPRFDLVLLGLGADGHTASLFPHSPALARRDRLVVANWVEELSAHRLTMTFELLNAAREVLFLVAGASKAEALQSVLEGHRDVERFPAQGIDPIDGTVRWLVDEKAARRLRG